MEFQKEISRSIELNGALPWLTEASKEPVDITPRCSLSYSDLKDISDRRMLSDNVENAFQKIMEKHFQKKTVCRIQF